MGDLRRGKGGFPGRTHVGVAGVTEESGWKIKESVRKIISE